MAAILSLYLLGALATFAGFLWFANGDIMGRTAFGVAALCGVLWPILVVGVVQMLAIMVLFGSADPEK
jgi:hypothetical protein